MRNIFFVLLFVNIALIFFSQEKKPDWINKVPQSDTYQYFVGIANYKFGKDDEGLSQAKNGAMNDVSNFIISNINSTMQERLISAEKNGKEFFENWIKKDFLIQSETTVSGVSFKEQYNDKKSKVWYVLASIEKEKIKDLIEKNLDPLGFELKKILIQMNKKYPHINSLALTNFNYKDKYYAGEFSNYIKSKISSVFNKLGFLSEYSDPEFFAYLDQSGLVNTKGFSVKENENQKNVYKKVQGFMSGSYWDMDDENIEIKVKVYDIERKEYTANEMFTVKKKLFGNMKFRPDNIDQFEKKYGDISKMLNNQEFNIRIWPNKGDNATYKDGEYIVPYFLSNKDCFLRVYLVGADGKTALIFPNYFDKKNFIQSGKIYKIGDPKFSSFVIELSKPYGSEMLIAIASLSEFENKIDFEDELPVYDENINLKGVLIQGIDNKSKETIVQSTAVYTIIPK